MGVLNISDKPIKYNEPELLLSNIDKPCFSQTKLTLQCQ